MLNDLALRQREQFYEEHGAYVNTPEGPIIFEDGAVDENSVTGLGRLMEPPDDEYQLAQIRCRYFQIVAEQAAEAFDTYKAYLGGTGRREAAWATLYTEQDRLEYLQELRRQAKRAQGRYAKAKRAVKDNMPAWMREREEAEIASAASQHKFRDAVDSIEL